MPERILQIVTVMNRGGLETMLMNYYRHIDKNKIQFDFLVHREEKGDYEDEILSLGGRVFRVPVLNPFSPSYFKALDIFFGEHKYNTVHCHLDCMSAYPLMIAKKHGVKNRFAHAHNKSQDKNLKYPIKLFSKKLICSNATQLFACGKEAGDWMFGGKEYRILNNAIDAMQFSFNCSMRKQSREETGIGNNFTLIHVGRFFPQKNHDFLIDIFNAVVSKKDDSILLLVGTGDNEQKIRDKVHSLGLENKVKFLGLRQDIPALLSAADVFLFPSLYEGLSLATVEAQASGLPCIMSDKIPHECKLTDEVCFLSLDKSADEWAEMILSFADNDRKNNYDIVSAAGFDIRTQVSYLEKIYLNCE